MATSVESSALNCEVRPGTVSRWQNNGSNYPGLDHLAAAAVALYLGSQDLFMDAPRKTRAAELTKNIGPALAEAQKSVLDALEDGDQSKIQKAVGDARKPYRGTAAEAWFNDAELIGRLKQGYANFEKQAASAKPSPKERKQFAAQLEEAGSKMTTSQFKAELSTLVAKARG